MLDFGLRPDDPAVHLLPAWNTFGEGARAAYLRALALAPAKALPALPYHGHINPDIVEGIPFTLGQVTAESEPGHPLQR